MAFLNQDETQFERGPIFELLKGRVFDLVEAQGLVNHIIPAPIPENKPESHQSAKAVEEQPKLVDFDLTQATREASRLAKTISEMHLNPSLNDVDSSSVMTTQSDSIVNDYEQWAAASKLEIK